MPPFHQMCLGLQLFPKTATTFSIPIFICISFKPCCTHQLESSVSDRESESLGPSAKTDKPQWWPECFPITSRRTIHAVKITWKGQLKKKNRIAHFGRYRLQWDLIHTCGHSVKFCYGTHSKMTWYMFGIATNATRSIKVFFLSRLSSLAIRNCATDVKKNIFILWLVSMRDVWFNAGGRTRWWWGGR